MWWVIGIAIAVLLGIAIGVYLAFVYIGWKIGL